MKTRYILVLFQIFFMINVANAQVTGYMGKRAFVEYHADLSLFGATFTHNLNLNYIIKRRTVIGLDIAAFDRTHTKDSTTIFGVNNTINGRILSLRADFHINKSVAPLGNYLGIRLINASGKYWDPETNQNKRISKYGFGVGWGYRRVYYNRMTFKVTGSINLIGDGEIEPEFGINDTLNSPLRTLQSLYSFNIGAGIGILLF